MHLSFWSDSVRVFDAEDLLTDRLLLRTRAETIWVLTPGEHH